MRTPMIRLQLLVGLACVAIATPMVRSDAQGTGALRDQPIPRDLVEALVSGGMTRAAPSIVVGELPPSLAGKVFVPAGARILGGTYSNVGAMGVLMSSSRPDSLIAQYRQELPKQGWSPFAPPTQASYATWGFVDSPGSSPSISASAIGLAAMGGMGSIGPSVETLTYCGLGMTLVIQIDPVGFTDSRIKLTTNGTNICAMMAQQSLQIAQMRAGNDPSSSIERAPILTNPVNARNTNTCPQVNTNGIPSSTKLSTPMSAEELFAHYGKQLADSGWKPSATMTQVREWVRTDTAGIKHFVELRIRTPADAPACRELDMNVRALTKR